MLGVSFASLSGFRGAILASLVFLAPSRARAPIAAASQERPGEGAAIPAASAGLPAAPLRLGALGVDYRPSDVVLALLEFGPNTDAVLLLDGRTAGVYAGVIERWIGIPIEGTPLPPAAIQSLGLHALSVQAVAVDLAGASNEVDHVYGFIADLRLGGMATPARFLVPRGNASSAGEAIALAIDLAATRGVRARRAPAVLLASDDACKDACAETKKKQYQRCWDALKRCEAKCPVEAIGGGTIGWIAGPWGAAIAGVATGLWCLWDCDETYDDCTESADEAYESCLSGCG